MFFHFVFSLYLPHPLEFLRVLSLEKSRATRVTFRDQKHWNRLKDKKVIAKNNPKIQRIFVFLVSFFILFFLITPKPFGVSNRSLQGRWLCTPATFCSKESWNRWKNKKVIRKKTKNKMSFFFFFFLFFVFFILFFGLTSEPFGVFDRGLLRAVAVHKGNFLQ